MKAVEMMKKYKINEGFRVNERASKTGVKWGYAGKKTEEEKNKLVRDFEEHNCWSHQVGLRVTDIETGEVVYEKVLY